jgi:large subunit ribosomal protein L13
VIKTFSLKASQITRDWQVLDAGQKLKQKVYYRHSGYPGGLKSRTLEQQLAKFPTRVIESAVRGMLPRTALGEAMFKRLHVYAGPTHPHRGQVGQIEPGEERAT